MPNITLRFETQAELGAANKVLQNLEQQIGKAKATGKAYDDLKAKHAELQAAIAASAAALPPSPNPVPLEEQNDTGDGKGKGVKSWIANLKAFKKNAHDIPGVGNLIMALKNPLVGGGIAIGAAAEAWVKFREAQREKREILEVANALEDQNIALRNLGKSAEASKEEIGAAFVKAAEKAEKSTKAYDDAMRAPGVR